MITTINISLNTPPGYNVKNLENRLTEYARQIVAEDTQSNDSEEPIVLSQEMVTAARKAEQEYRAGKCLDDASFNKCFGKWL